MAPKRKNSQPEYPTTARERKKQKVAFARTIEVQAATPASVSNDAVAGPSRIVAVDSMKGLPSTIDVEKFAEARSFEIDAMQKAMKSASASSTQRAWQTLPRHLRRRAASHDVRRVPLRLREKARAEMDPVRRKALGRSIPKRGKANRISRTEALLKRQRNKTWLETHIWHAKRMHMENMWGYRLATHPTEKAFRPSHRASVHGSILHDASYYSLIELKGPEKVLRSILEACCDPQGQGPGARRFVTGTRILETHIYKPGSYPFDLVAPITVIWRPTCASSSSTSQDKTSVHPPQPAAGETSTTKKKKKRKGKGKAGDEGTATGTTLQVDENALRTVWIRSHPTVHDDVFSTLQTTASLVLDAAKRANPNPVEGEEVEVELSDLRGHINVFEIMGPKANQVLKGALTPIAEEQREEFKNFWSSLADLQTSGSVPRGMVIGFKVYDPRLKFPPKNAKPRKSESSSQQQLSSALTTFPTAALAQSEIWDEKSRAGLQKPRFKKKSLDSRRSNNLVPGTALAPSPQDNRVPLMLIQRSLENPGPPASGTSQAGLHGWTVILPAGWGMPFFSALTYTGTRVGGQRERATQAFEASMLTFPRDFPATGAYNSYAVARAAEEQRLWERKPPAKRANWEKVGTRSPWRADWEVVLKLENAGQGGLVSTQREADDELPKEDIRPWLLRGAEVGAILDRITQLRDPGSGLAAELNQLRTKRNQIPLDARKGMELLRGALVMVQLRMCGRGSPGDLAIIYAVEDEEAKLWNGVIEHRKRADAIGGGETQNEIQLSELRPSPDAIIGYVTTGNFSLSRGEGFAIGAVALSQVLELRRQTQRLRTINLLVKVRDREGIVCRAAFLRMLDL